MTDSRAARSVPFPEFAPDAVLRYTTGDLIELQAYCTGFAAGDTSPEAQEKRLEQPWLGIVEKLLDKQDAGFVRKAVQLGLKNPGGFGRPNLSDDDLDDLPFSPGAVTQKLADALYCAVSGRPYSEVEAARQKPDGG